MLFGSTIAPCLLSAVFLVGCAPPSPESKPESGTSAEPSVACGIDLASLADPDVVDALIDIGGKLARIDAYACVVKVTSDVPQGVLAYVDEICFRRPAFFSCRHTQTEHPIPTAKGMTYHTVGDEKSFRQEVRQGGCPEQIVKQLAANSGITLSPENLERMKDEIPAAQAYSYDLELLKQKGIAPEDVEAGWGRLFDPFRSMDTAKLKLLRQDDETWVFSSSPSRPMPRFAEMQVTIGKVDGILRSAHYLNSDGKIDTVETISEVDLSPNLPADQFTIQFAEGMTTTDQTGAIVASLSGGSP